MVCCHPQQCLSALWRLLGPKQSYPSPTHRHAALAASSGDDNDPMATLVTSPASTSQHRPGLQGKEYQVSDSIQIPEEAQSLHPPTQLDDAVRGQAKHSARTIASQRYVARRRQSTHTSPFRRAAALHHKLQQQARDRRQCYHRLAKKNVLAAKLNAADEAEIIQSAMLAANHYDLSIHTCVGEHYSYSHVGYAAGDGNCMWRAAYKALCATTSSPMSSRAPRTWSGWKQLKKKCLRHAASLQLNDFMETALIAEQVAQLKMHGAWGNAFALIILASYTKQEFQIRQPNRLVCYRPPQAHDVVIMDLTDQHFSPMNRNKMGRPWQTEIDSLMDSSAYELNHAYAGGMRRLGEPPMPDQNRQRGPYAEPQREHARHQRWLQEMVQRHRETLLRIHNLNVEMEVLIDEAQDQQHSFRFTQNRLITYLGLHREEIEEVQHLADMARHVPPVWGHYVRQAQQDEFELIARNLEELIPHMRDRIGHGLRLLYGDDRHLPLMPLIPYEFEVQIRDILVHTRAILNTELTAYHAQWRPQPNRPRPTDGRPRGPPQAQQHDQLGQPQPQAPEPPVPDPQPDLPDGQQGGMERQRTRSPPADRGQADALQRFRLWLDQISHEVGTSRRSIQAILEEIQRVTDERTAQYLSNEEMHAHLQVCLRTLREEAPALHRAAEQLRDTPLPLGRYVHQALQDEAGTTSANMTAQVLQMQGVVDNFLHQAEHYDIRTDELERAVHWILEDIQENQAFIQAFRDHHLEQYYAHRGAGSPPRHPSSGDPQAGGAHHSGHRHRERIKGGVPS